MADQQSDRHEDHTTSTTRSESTKQTVGEETNFLGDLTDGRKPGEWETKYTPAAQDLINSEKNYLFIVFIITLIVPLILGVIHYEVITIHPYLRLKKYIFAFCGGALGGTLYSGKWLVHSVAKFSWNADRRLWRIYTPFASGALALCITLLIDSGVMGANDISNTSFTKAFGIGFLVGYFSDNAIGKLTELAKVFFGSSQTKG